MGKRKFDSYTKPLSPVSLCGQAGANKVDETMFASEASAGFPLERCMRVLPHHGDTGGFFIAVLRKTAPVGDLPFSTTNAKCVPAAAGFMV